MKKKTPYHIIKARYTTEKTTVLEGLKNASSNKSLERCQRPKVVFLVDKNAHKHDISSAVEEIYKERNVRVTSVNTITVKPKKRRVRGFKGFRSGFKKAIVTLEQGDSIDEGV